MNVNKPAAEMTALAAAQAAAQTAAQKAGQQAEVVKANPPVKTLPAGASVTIRVARESRVVAERAPEINQQKIEAVRSAIERGTFKPDPEIIADKLLAGSREVMNRVRGRA